MNSRDTSKYLISLATTNICEAKCWMSSIVSLICCVMVSSHWATLCDVDDATYEDPKKSSHFSQRLVEFNTAVLLLLCFVWCYRISVASFKDRTVLVSVLLNESLSCCQQNRVSPWFVRPGSRAPAQFWLTTPTLDVWCQAENTCTCTSTQMLACKRPAHMFITLVLTLMFIRNLQ